MRYRRTFEYPPPIEEHEYHQKMAEELKAELLRRAEKWEQTHDDRAP